MPIWFNISYSRTAQNRIVKNEALPKPGLILYEKDYYAVFVLIVNFLSLKEENISAK